MNFTVNFSMGGRRLLVEPLDGIKLYDLCVDATIRPDLDPEIICKDEVIYGWKTLIDTDFSFQIPVNDARLSGHFGTYSKIDVYVSPETLKKYIVPTITIDKDLDGKIVRVMAKQAISWENLIRMWFESGYSLVI